MRAVITGATGGIGGATTRALGRAGYEVIITGIDLEAGKKVIDKLEARASGPLLCLRCYQRGAGGTRPSPRSARSLVLWICWSTT